MASQLHPPRSTGRTREAWLEALLAALRPLFSASGYTLPDAIRVTCSWPTHGATAMRHRVVGQAFASSASVAGVHETFISPALEDPLEVAAVLVHELVHHAVGIPAGHGPKFRRCALAVGLVGPMRSTEAGDELRERLHALTARLGPYPHSQVLATSRRKQSTRMLKVECGGCGCIARMTRTWLEMSGPPTCGCGSRMREPRQQVLPTGTRDLARNEVAQHREMP